MALEGPVVPLEEVRLEPYRVRPNEPTADMDRPCDRHLREPNAGGTAFDPLRQQGQSRISQDH